MKKNLKFLLGGIGIVGSIGAVVPVITSCVSKVNNIDLSKYRFVVQRAIHQYKVYDIVLWKYEDGFWTSIAIERVNENQLGELEKVAKKHNIEIEWNLFAKINIGKPNYEE